MSSEPSSLASRSCTPCRGGIPPLSREEVEAHHRQTQNFAGALAFVQRAGDLAEAEGHHPDISFGWGYATVSLQTKKIKGLHENDFIMAAKLDQIASQALTAISA